MQFTIRMDTQSLDIKALEDHLQALDPAALADVDALNRTVRVSTSLSEHEVAAGLYRIGHAIDASRIEREPSVCCGGCGG